MSHSSSRAGMMKTSSTSRDALSRASFNSSWRYPCCLLNARERQTTTASLVRIALRISLCQSCPGWRFAASSHASIPSRLNRWCSLWISSRSLCAWMRNARTCFDLFIHHSQSQKENKDGYCIRTYVSSQARRIGVRLIS